MPDDACFSAAGALGEGKPWRSIETLSWRDDCNACEIINFLSRPGSRRDATFPGGARRPTWCMPHGWAAAPITQL